MSEQAKLLRQEFDRSFRGPRALPDARGHHFLAVRVGGNPFALEVSEIAGLYADRTIIALPSPQKALLGLARFRSEIAAIFDLRRLLGATESAPGRWLVLVRAPDLAGLVFDQFEGHVIGEAVGETLMTGEIVRPILRIREVVERLQKRGEE